MTSDLISTAERIMKMAAKEGAEHAEVYIESRENLVMRITKVSGKDNFSARDQVMTGAALRVIKGGALGFAYLSNLGDESVKSSVRSALKVAEPQAGIESFLGQPRSFSRVSGILDKHTAEMRPEEAMSNAEVIRKSATEVDSRLVTVYEALFGRSKHGFAIVNTQGLNVEDYGSFARMAIGISAKDGKEAKMEVYDVERSVKDVGIVKDFASKNAHNVLKYLGSKKVEPKKMTVILSPFAVAELFTYAFTNAFCADNVQSKASVLEGKIGEQVASEAVTLVDDGTFEGGLTSFKMDDEGMPSKRTTLIEKGILKSYIHNNQSASIASVESTGNCVRWELPTVDYFFYRSFRRLPRVFPTNVIFEPGSTSIDTMIREVRDGIYIDRTDPAFTARPDGSFSVSVLYGFKIENGQLSTPISGMRIAGNLFDYAKKVDVVGNAPEKNLPTLYPSCVITPPIRVQDASIQA
nr:TldD/PmbA family protein [Candidatus Njordarchaeum guaymaensis]